MIFAGICLRTPNVQRLSAFYQAVLQTTSDGNDDIHQEIHTQGAALAILKVDTEVPGNANLSLAFTVDDVDKEYERLRTLQVTVIDPPTTRPWGARDMMFADPDGNHAVFRSFLKADRDI
ncbi:MAG: VOC family protein [Oscillospiraceae bacterium]|nr:VOC family protein [Oscillospiraceae bacterium]